MSARGRTGGRQCWDRSQPGRSSSTRRTDHALNTSSPFLRDSAALLPRTYNVKACMLSNVPAEERIYAAVDGATTHSMVPSLRLLGRRRSSGHDGCCRRGVRERLRRLPRRRQLRALHDDNGHGALHVAGRCRSWQRPRRRKRRCAGQRCSGVHRVWCDVLR